MRGEKMKKIIFGIVVFAFIWLVSPVTGFSASSNPPEVESYDIEIELVPDARLDYAGFIGVLYGNRPDWNKLDSMNRYPYMKARALVTLDLGENPHDSLVFYIHSELRTHYVRLGGTDLDFTQETAYYPSSYSGVATKVRIDLKGLSGQRKLLIAYGGMFNPNYSRSPSNYMRIDTEGAYLRGYGYSLWFPVFLEASKTPYVTDFENVKIITPRPFVGVFTGQRLEESTDDGQRISDWKAINTAVTDVQLSIRPYIVQEKDAIYLYYLANEKSEASAGDILQFVSRLKDLYSSQFKEIKTTPQLHIAELPNFASGISSGNMIGMTSGQWQDFSLEGEEDNLKLLVAHELVHTYVHVPTQRQDPISALAVEGFPSYFHLPVLAEIMGESWYRKYMQMVEESYLRKKETHMTARGDALPVEKPILSLTYDDIGTYKDTFILNDRVRLFLNFIRDELGKDAFKKFTRELCHMPRLTVPLFKQIISQYLPGRDQDISIWLETDEYPERFHLRD
jgi:hypothetical protein